MFDPSTPNGEAWSCAALLRVGDTDFELCINPPTVDSLSLQVNMGSGQVLRGRLALCRLLKEDSSKACVEGVHIIEVILIIVGLHWQPTCMF